MCYGIIHHSNILESHSIVMAHVSVYLRDYKLLHEIDRLVELGYFRTRSHAFEFALKLLVEQYRKGIRF